MEKLTWLVCAVLAAGCGSAVHCIEGSSACESKQADTSGDASLIRPSETDSGAGQRTTADASATADASTSEAHGAERDAGSPHEMIPDVDDTDAGKAGPTRVGAIDKVDLLFVVDNSNSMSTRQASLKAALPAFMEALTSGMRANGEPTGYPALHDLHIGVVSTDMGVAGINFPGSGCRADGGDDGRLLHMPRGADCQPSYPNFLAYDASSKQAPAQLAGDFACIAGLGTGGCGFEQSLDAPLKALWPSVYTDDTGHAVEPNPITFVSVTAEGTRGRGDVPGADGGNLGFLRNDPQNPSLIAIVLLTDEDDSSAKTTEFLAPPSQLPSDSPYITEDINLRSFYNHDKLFDVEKRYVHAFRLLRTDPHRLVFAAIAGIPTDLVDSTALRAIDPSDPQSRDAFFDRILNDPRMQETPDPATNPGMGTGNLIPSCQRMDPVTNAKVFATPPRRIVQLAKLLGPQGLVQSLCQDDFAPAIDAIVNLIGTQLAAKQ